MVYIGQRNAEWARTLAQAQGFKCPYCGGELDLSIRTRRDPRFVTVDHVLAKSRGGADALGNTVAMHTLCNTMKADRLPTGCVLVWLLAVNNRIGVQPARW